MGLSGNFYDGLKARRFPIEVFIEGKTLILKNVTEKIHVEWSLDSLSIIEHPIDDMSGIFASSHHSDARLAVDKYVFDEIFSRLSKKQRKTTHASWKKIAVFAFLVLVIWGGGYLLIPKAASLFVSFIPERVENMIGDSMTHVILATEKDKIKPLENSESERILNKMVKRLSEASKIQRPFYIHILKTDESPNAFALPNGHIFVYQSLLDAADSPEEIAGVLAHEMSHIIKHHSMISLIEYYGFLILLNPGFDSTTKLGLTEVCVKPNSQKVEIEADDTAAELLLAAKINPTGLQHFFRKIEKYDPEHSFSAFLSTHPSSNQRFNNLEKFKKLKKTDSILTEAEWKILKKYVQP